MNDRSRKMIDQSKLQKVDADAEERPKLPILGNNSSDYSLNVLKSRNFLK